MGYRVAAREARFEQEIKRSRFIGIGCRVSSPEEAAATLEELRREFPGATHHCSAYLLGDPRNSSNLRADDDGEPAGTAGKPMLNVLQHKNVGDLLLVVVRYFGGIKLGAGGLVRAYSSTASGTMDALECVDAVPERDGVLALDYPDEPPIRRALEELGVTVLRSQYGARVELSLRLPEDRWGEISKSLLERTSGRAKLVAV